MNLKLRIFPLSKKRSVRYIDARKGGRTYLVSVLIAAVFGLGFRLYFSPPRLKAWVTESLEQQKRQMDHPFALSFSDVSLRLANGWLPQLAVVVTGVRVALNPVCHPEASIFVGELRLPFRILALLSGRVAVGVVGARDVRIDLDGLKERCDKAKGDESGKSKSKVSNEITQKNDSAGAVPVWWTGDQFDEVRRFVEGVEFSRAVLQFESKQKEINLDSFSVLFKSDGRLQLATEVQIPAALTFGEAVPVLKIVGEAVNTRADLSIGARVSEGSLSTTAVLTPSADQMVQIDARMTVHSLPLSVLTPLMRKASLVNERFDPKFLWLDCAASIHGVFQGLFQTSPLYLQACRIEGDGTDVELKAAERSPNGVWQPFQVQVAALRLAKLFSTIGVRGPDGVVSDFGQLGGEIRVDSPRDAKFTGQLRNVSVGFSNHGIRATQAVTSIDVALSILDDQVQASLKNVVLANGSATVTANAALDRERQSGSFSGDVSKLKFDPAVQAILVNGSLGEVAGHFSAQFGSKISSKFRAKLASPMVMSFESGFSIAETAARDFSFKQLTVKVGRDGEADPWLSVDGPGFDLKKSAALFRSIEPVFFGHDFNGDGLHFERLHIDGGIQSQGAIGWKAAKATLEHGLVVLTSAGSMNQDHLIEGRLTIDFPKVKQLTWNLSGPDSALQIRGVGDAFEQLHQRAEINDQVLGL